MLFQSKIAAGIDGYYYVLQIASFKKFGHFYFSANTPIILYFFSALSLFNDNPVFTIKFGTLILQGLLYSGIATILHNLTKNVLLAALGVFLVAFSTLHLYFLSEFLSNLGALVFLIWGVFGIIKTLETKKESWFCFANLLFVAAIFSHRSMFWLIISAFFIILIAHCWLKYATSSKRAVIFSLLILFLLFFPLISAWQTIFELPEKFSSELSKYPQNPFRSLVLMESPMLLIVGVSVFLILYFKPQLLRENSIGLILVSISVWSFLFTLNPFLNHQKGVSGIVARLDVLAFLQIAIALPLLFHLLFSYSKKFTLAIVALFLPLLILSWFVPFPVGLRTEYLQTREKLVSELPSMRSQICEKPFIVARHGEQFLVTAILQIPSQQKPPIETEYQCVYWLIHEEENFALIEDSQLRKTFEELNPEQIQSRISANPHLRELLRNSPR